MRQASERIERGTVLDGRYEIEAIVGSGGFSTVYRARQKPVDRPVAVKVLEADEEGDSDKFEEVLERFRREAKVVAQLESPSTVELYDFGRSGDGDVYMVLEYVDGVPLSRIDDLPMAPGRVVRILEQTLDSLDEAHAYGVLHRDIKPSNLMLHEVRGEPDRLKVLDFGVAKLLRADREVSQQLTRQDVLVGTPRYLAPELATKNNPGPSSDVYSLGLVAYELLVGEKAVDGEGTMAVLGNHLQEDFQAKLPESAAISDDLRRIVDRMIRKDRGERYETAAAVRDDLDDLAELDDGVGRDGAATDGGAKGGGAERMNASESRVSGTAEPTEKRGDLPSTETMGRPPGEADDDEGVRVGETSTEKNEAVETTSDEAPTTSALDWEEVDDPIEPTENASQSGEAGEGEPASLDDIDEDAPPPVAPGGKADDPGDGADRSSDDEMSEADASSDPHGDGTDGGIGEGASWETVLEGGETGDRPAEPGREGAAQAAEQPTSEVAMWVVTVTAGTLLVVFITLVVLIVLTLVR